MVRARVLAGDVWPGLRKRGQAGNTEILIRVETCPVREFQYFLPDPFLVVDVTPTTPGGVDGILHIFLPVGGFEGVAAASS